MAVEPIVKVFMSYVYTIKTIYDVPLAPRRQISGRIAHLAALNSASSLQGKWKMKGEA